MLLCTQLLEFTVLLRTNTASSLPTDILLALVQGCTLWQVGGALSVTAAMLSIRLVSYSSFSISIKCSDVQEQLALSPSEGVTQRRVGHAEARITRKPVSRKPCTRRCSLNPLCKLTFSRLCKQPPCICLLRTLIWLGCREAQQLCCVFSNEIISPWQREVSNVRDGAN